MQRLLIPEVKLISDEENPVLIKSENSKLYINSGEALCAYSGVNNFTQIKLVDLPQQDPAISGVLWQDENGFLKISLG